MRTVYACVFDVHPSPPLTPLAGFEKLRELAMGWIRESYQQEGQAAALVISDGGSMHPQPNHTIKIGREKGGVCELISIEWSHPDDDDLALNRTTTCCLARNGKNLQVSISVRIASTQPIVKPLVFSVSRPRLVDLLVMTFPCYVGKTRVHSLPQELDRFDVPSFVDNTLCWPDRRLPTVVVTPEDAPGQYLVDPPQLQKAVLGFAQVVCLRDKSATYELSHALGKELSCYQGAVRLYWPGLTLAANPVDHPLYLPDSIRWHAEHRQPLDRYLFRMLAGISGFRFSHAPETALVREFIDRDRQDRVHHILSQLRTAEETQEIVTMLEQAWDQNKQLKQENDQLRQENGKLVEDLESLKEALGEAGRTGRRGEPSSPDSPALSSPDFPNVAEAVAKAREMFANSLVFLDSAVASAADSPYQQPDRIHDLLGVLHELVGRWQREGHLGEPWKFALKNKGYDYKEHISPTARGKFGDEYSFLHDGQKLLFENHVTLGARGPETCISIHWYRDDSQKKLIIGWCGRHRSNTLS